MTLLELQGGVLLGYINPGTGSLVLQLILVGIAGLFVALKSTWGTLLDFLMGRRKGRR